MVPRAATRIQEEDTCETPLVVHGRHPLNAVPQARVASFQLLSAVGS